MLSLSAYDMPVKHIYNPVTHTPPIILSAFKATDPQSS